MAYGHDNDATDAGQFGGRHSAASRPATNLEDVFDDPAHGEIGRDRLGVHFAWEGVLLLGALALGYLLYANHRDAMRGDSLKSMLVSWTILGVLAVAASITLRVGAVNLALGSIAAASSLYYAQHGADGLVETSVWPVLLGLAVGAAIALLVVGFHVPGWAGSIVGALVAIAWIEKNFQGPIEVAGTENPNDQAYYWIGGFVLISVIGGLLCLIKPVRRGVGRFRPVGDPAVRRGGVAATLTSAGLILSGGLAALAGVLAGAAAGVANEQVPAPVTGLQATALAIGAALVGGASAYGRRGGVFGTVLATALVTLLIVYGQQENWGISPWVLAAGAIATGLIVTRLVETFGRPLSMDDGPDDWSDVGIASTSSWSSTTPSTTAADTWSGLSSQPTSPATTTSTSQWGAETDRWR
jgi:ribose/xylose/arabinose/galactoside ABC-type transport system permease subunit